MDTTDDETLVKAARQLLRWSQELLSKESGVGLATVRRFESGTRIREALLEKLFATLRTHGAWFLRDVSVDGVKLGVAVGLRPGAKRMPRIGNVIHEPLEVEGPRPVGRPPTAKSLEDKKPKGTRTTKARAATVAAPAPKPRATRVATAAGAKTKAKHRRKLPAGT